MGQPPPSIVVLGTQFLVPYHVNILVHPSSSSSSFSDGNMVITDVNRGVLLKVEPQNTTIHHQRVIVDVHDRFIVTLREKHMTGHARWNAFRGDSNADSDKLFTTTRSNMIQKKTGVSISLETTTNDCDFNIKGSWSQKRCAICVGDSSTIIAQMQPWDAVSFMVKIQPNVDYAFVVALIAIIDAMKSTERKDKIADNAKKVGKVLSTIVIGPAGFGVV